MLKLNDGRRKLEKRGESGGLIVWKHLTIESKLLKEKIKEGYKNAKLTTKCFPGVKVLRPKGNPEYNVTQIVICVRLTFGNS